jgi:hypothetical protein
MEYQITIEVSDYGHESENGERFLRAFMETHPKVGPAVAQNTDTGVLTIVFSFDVAEGTNPAEAAATVFTDGAHATGLPATRILSMHIDLVEEEDRTEDRQPILA